MENTCLLLSKKIQYHAVLVFKNYELSKTMLDVQKQRIWRDGKSVHPKTEGKSVHRKRTTRPERDKMHVQHHNSSLDDVPIDQGMLCSFPASRHG